MAIRPYPNDRQPNPSQLTLRQFVNKGISYYNAIEHGTPSDRLKFLKLVLTGRDGVDLDTQTHITLNASQGLDDLAQVTTTRDFDSLIGTTKTLPYSVPVTIWPAPSFRETLKMNSHMTSLALDDAGNALSVPMHHIPNLPLGKVAHRSVIRVFFPRMYRSGQTRAIPSTDIELIYNRCLRPIVQRLMPNQATHWPATYAIALQTARDRAGRLHLGSLDIPAHVLPDFGRQYLEQVSQLRPQFEEAYFGHELRGWKAATVHNVANVSDNDDEVDYVHERVDALEDLTRILHMHLIRPAQWVVDVGLEFGLAGRVLTWRSNGHYALLRHLLPDVENIERSVKRSKKFYVDSQMQIKDFAGFRWTPGQVSDRILYLQAYTTEKSVSYQLHESIFRARRPSELLTKKTCKKLVDDLDEQSGILFACAGNDAANRDAARRQEGCARLEARVCLSDANDILTEFPRALINQSIAQIPAHLWWNFKWLRLGAVFMVINNIYKSKPSDFDSENSLVLGALSVWILNSVYRTPDTRFLKLAMEACSEVLLHADDDPDDDDAPTIPLMDEAGVYFFCDIVPDRQTRTLRIACPKTFSARLIAEAYDQGSMNDVRRLLGCGDVQVGRRAVNPERTANRSTQHTIDARNFRAADEPLPEIGRRLDGLPIPGSHHPRGPDVDYLRRHGGGNRDVEEDDDRLAGEISLKQHVQEILIQLYHDILHESPNKRQRSEGAWTNIPKALRAEQATENLYMRLEFPFTAVQWVISTEEQWKIHFDRFFPPKMPSHAGQNFGKCRYYHEYLALLRRLSPQHLTWVRKELHEKFNSLAWIPFTECDRMWSTRKANAQRWEHLPGNGAMEGPKIAVHPTALQRLRTSPSLRPVPVVPHEDESENDEEEVEDDMPVRAVVQRGGARQAQVRREEEEEEEEEDIQARVAVQGGGERQGQVRREEEEEEVA